SGGREQRREAALQRPGGHEHAERLRETAERRCRGEADEPGDERPFTTEQVAELAAEQQQTAEREGVRRDRPLAALGREAERPLRGRQRDVDDRCVEHDHDLATATSARTAQRLGEAAADTLRRTTP